MKKSRTKKPKKSKSGIREIHPNIYLGILALLVIVIYAQTTSYEFVGIDDDKLILENQVVTDPAVPFSATLSENFATVHYKPLVYASWKAEYQFISPDPWHFHLFNWLLHLANTLLLFFVGIKLFERLYLQNRAKTLFSAFLLALFFSINPLRIESVVWATERKDVLFAFFFLLSWLTYINYLETKKYHFILISSGLYLLSGLSKTMGITLLGVLFLTDFWSGRKIKIQWATEKIPHFIAFVALIIAYGFIGPHSPESLSDTATATAGGTLNLISSVPLIADLPFVAQWVVTTSIRFILWIVHILLPVYLSVLYSHNDIFGSLGASIFVFPFLVAALYSGAWLARKKSPAILGGLLFFAVALSPALVLKSSGTFVFLADRYTYIPSIGLFFIAIALLNRWADKRQRLYYTVIVAISVFYLGVALKNVPNWKNSERLYKQAIEISPGKSMLYQNLGKLYRRQKKYNLEFQAYNEGIKNIPNDYLLYSSRGKMYYMDGKTELALADFNKCLAISPGFVEGLSNRGAVYGTKEEWKKALADLDKALEIEPGDLHSLKNRGLIYFKTKQYEKNIVDYKKYLQLKPGDADVINTVGMCFNRLKRFDEAIAEFTRAIELNNKNASYFINRSYAYNAKGDKETALKDALRAEELGFAVNPGYINFLKN